MFSFIQCFLHPQEAQVDSSMQSRYTEIFPYMDRIFPKGQRSTCAFCQCEKTGNATKDQQWWYRQTTLASGPFPCY